MADSGAPVKCDSDKRSSRVDSKRPHSQFPPLFVRVSSAAKMLLKPSHLKFRERVRG